MGKSKYQIVLEVVDKFKKNLDKLQRGLKKVQGAVSYTHLTLPTNREV